MRDQVQLCARTRRSLATSVLLAAATFAASACSLLLDFDQDGLPCDASNGCLEGFACVDGQCVAASERPEGCGSCAAGFSCEPSSGECRPEGCDVRACAAGSRCTAADAGPAFCEPIASPSPGHRCTQDADCADAGAERFCLLGAVQDPQTGALRNGICVEPCAVPDAPCGDDAGACRPLSGVADAESGLVCVTAGMVTPCQDDQRCAPHGLLCTVFDHPSVGPTSLCDAPLSGGAAAGEACSVTVGDPSGFALCANGLCAPRPGTSTTQPLCLSPCVEGGCGAAVCAVSEFALSGVIRHLPLCVPQVTRCTPCGAEAPACGADAPRCSTLDGGAYCLSACSPDAGTGPLCPPEETCVQLPEGFRCVPATGACP